MKPIAVLETDALDTDAEWATVTKQLEDEGYLVIRLKPARHLYLHFPLPVSNGKESA